MMVTWKTSDPASGTVVSYTNDGAANTGFVSEQTEPLGQSVAVTDPEPPNEPTQYPSSYEQYLFSARESEWECKVSDEFYGGFQGRPDHCQDRVLMSFDRSLDQIYGFSSFDTRRIETYAWGTAAVKGSYEATITTEQEAMQWVLSITQKPASGGGSSSADSGYSHQSGERQWDVFAFAGDEGIPDELRLDVSFGGDPLLGDNMQNFETAVSVVRGILQEKGDNPCAKFFGGVGEDALNKLVAMVNESSFVPLNDTETGIHMVYNGIVDALTFHMPSDGYSAISPTLVEINTRGAFVSGQGKQIAGYTSATLASRVIQILP